MLIKFILAENLEQAKNRLNSVDFLIKAAQYFNSDEYPEQHRLGNIEINKNNIKELIKNSPNLRSYIESEQFELLDAMEAIKVNNRPINDRTKYVVLNWLITKYIQGKFLPEDTVKVPEYFADFFIFSPKFKNEPKDINAYDSLADIFATTKKYKELERQNLKFNPSSIKDVKTIINNEQYLIVQPLTTEASCELGKHTEWCTAKYPSQDKRNKFNFYNQQGPLFVIFDKSTGQRYQYHLESNQFNNEDDQNLINNSSQDVNNLVQNVKSLIINKFVKSPPFQSPYLPSSAVKIFKEQMMIHHIEPQYQNYAYYQLHLHVLNSLKEDKELKKRYPYLSFIYKNSYYEVKPKNVQDLQIMSMPQTLELVNKIIKDQRILGAAEYFAKSLIIIHRMDNEKLQSYMQHVVPELFDQSDFLQKLDQYEQD